MNLGLGGAMFLWVLMLWPILVVAVYYAVLRPVLANAPALAVLSMVSGYGIIAAIFVIFNRLKIDAALLSAALVMILPILATHILAKSFQKPIDSRASDHNI